MEQGRFGRAWLESGPTGSVLVCTIVAGLVVALVAGPVAAAATEVRITDVSFEGDGVVDRGNGEVILWQETTTTVTVDISTAGGEGEGHYDVCLRIEPTGGSGARLECKSRLLVGNQPTTVTFRRTTWPSESLGRGTLTVVITADTLTKEVTAEARRSVVVLERTGDFDSDGLPNDREFEVGTAFDRADTDADGVRDGLELDPYSTDPRSADTDHDGIDDGEELETYRTDPTTVDTDGDGLDDRSELFDHGTDPNRIDSDGDGLDDSAELNAHETDPTDPDSDGDGLGDAAEVETHQTDPTAADTDDDGLSDALEVHTFSTNPSAVDSDGDGLADGEEVWRFGTDPTMGDTDRDGLADGPEVNEHGTDPNAVDTDGDGLQDGPEVNRFGLDPTSVDSDGDGVPDGSEVDRPVPVFTPIVVAIVIGILGLGGWWLLKRRRGQTGDEPPEQPPDVPTDGPGNDLAIDRPPLTNEDRVLSILEESGGRMKQSRIVEETDWSKSTVSRVLSRMENDGQISKISLGRGNLITLPGEEPPKSKPPFNGGAPPEQASR